LHSIEGSSVKCALIFNCLLSFFSVRKYNRKPDYLFADLTKSKEVEKLATTIKGLYPKGVDILINNAGQGRRQFKIPVLDLEDFPLNLLYFYTFSFLNFIFIYFVYKSSGLIYGGAQPENP